MFKGISRNRIIIYLFYLFLIAGLFLLYLKPKPGLFLELYAFHSDFLNIVMKGLTSLGSGLAAVVLVLLLFLLKIRYGFYIGLSAAVSGIVTQLLKIFVFPGHHRPVKYFSDMGISLDTVSGVHIHFYHSFPSGHTTTAFAIWFGLSFIVRNMLPENHTLHIWRLLSDIPGSTLPSIFPKILLAELLLAVLQQCCFIIMWAHGKRIG